MLILSDLARKVKHDRSVRGLFESRLGEIHICSEISAFLSALETSAEHFILGFLKEYFDVKAISDKRF